MIFRVYPSYIFAPITIAVLFLILFCWFLISAIQQAQNGTARVNLLLRTLIALILPSIMFVSMLYIALFMYSKQILVNDQSLITQSLFNKMEIPWKDISSINGNFILTTRLGLFSENNYAWMDVKMQSGEINHISLRFIANTRVLEEFIREKVPYQ